VLRLANPLVRIVLESRAHGPLSRQLVLLRYRGHRSGREYRIPLRYAETVDGRVIALAVASEGKQWWRSFVAPRPATLTLRGERIAARGTLAQGGARRAALDAYIARHPRSRRVAQGAAAVVFDRAGG
jgi:hypothetical protein